MSTSTTKTGYKLVISSLNSGSVQMTFTAEDDGWSDAFAESFWAAVSGLAWPPGCGVSIDNKTVVTSNVFTANTSGASLTFS